MNPSSLPDFSNTAIAFAGKSDKDLQKAAWLFSIMNQPTIVHWGSKLGLWAVKNRLPFANTIVRNTIFERFCGGTSLSNCQATLQQLAQQKVSAILNYGAEAKHTEKEFEAAKEEFLRAIDFATTVKNAPIVCVKITGLANFDLLAKVQAKAALTIEEKKAYQQLINRLSIIGQAAEDKKVSLYIDAEESWIQDTIDDLTNDLMATHNQQQAIVFNTFQMYRHDRLAYLKKSYSLAREQGFILGAKIVRGAYMVKERARAKEKDYPSPIQKDKAATDKDYNAAIRFCVDNLEWIASCNASHNKDSNLLQAQLIVEMGIAKNHPHLRFCQLYGMSDQITFNLAATGFNAMKYLPYGAIREVIPFLIRRAQENTAVNGEMGREYRLLLEEQQRRKNTTID